MSHVTKPYVTCQNSGNAHVVVSILGVKGHMLGAGGGVCVCGGGGGGYMYARFQETLSMVDRVGAGGQTATTVSSLPYLGARPILQTAL